jgi:hypothetical protein
MGPSADLVSETAAAMVSNGLQAAGYHYLNLDDGIVQVGHVLGLRPTGAGRPRRVTCTLQLAAQCRQCGCRAESRTQSVRWAFRSTGTSSLHPTPRATVFPPPPHTHTRTPDLCNACALHA